VSDGVDSGRANPERERRQRRGVKLSRFPRSHAERAERGIVVFDAPRLDLEDIVGWLPMPDNHPAAASSGGNASPVGGTDPRESSVL
jgi:hypothetical protein